MIRSQLLLMIVNERVTSSPRSLDPLETAKLMVYATHQIRSVARNALQRSGYQPKTKQKRQLFILQGLPGIGRERAIKLLDRFGSVERVITANREELESVDGIGKDTADKIKWAVSEQITAYGFDTDSPNFTDLFTTT